jgi:two-component system, NtrC family, sensor histidine kinase KinB
MSIRNYFVIFVAIVVGFPLSIAFLLTKYQQTNELPFLVLSKLGFAAGMIVFIFSIACVAYLVHALLVRPMRLTIKEILSFVENSESTILQNIAGAPREINTLRESLNKFIAKVSDLHEKDTEVSRVKSDFISTAAHQLRTPLTGIRWALQALQNESLTEDQKMLVKNALDKSHDLVAVVGTLLDISSIESGKYKYTFTAVNLSMLVTSITNDFSPLSKETNVSLVRVQDCEVFPDVKADADRIKWIINNLIENALRYTPAGGSVQVSMNSMPGKIRVFVQDTGIGILAKDRNNIFERFYRAGNAITKENKGNGLGLYIARTIATDHGGDLNFTANTNGIGTIFTLSLPIMS